MLHLFPGVFERQEPVRVQALRAEFPVERFDERIVRRLPGSGEVERHVVLICPQIEIAGDELQASIDANGIWKANQFFKLPKRSQPRIFSGVEAFF